MPAYGVEILRHKAELHETNERIHELLRQLEMEDPAKQVNEKQKDRKGLAKAASRFERQTSPEDAFEVHERLHELFASLHLEERYEMLAQVCDWFVGHTPAAQKDIAILDRADKECLQRECERAWTALATDDTLRKKERNAVRQVHQFVQAVAEKHRELNSGSKGSLDSDSIVRFDDRLISLSDEELKKEVEIMREKVRQKEEAVVLIVLNIAERGSFLTESRIEHIKANFAQQTIDLVAEQEEIWLVAEEELRRLEEQKDLIYETLGYVRSSAKAHDVRPPPEHLMEYLQRKRFEVQSVHRAPLLAKRMEDYGKDLEEPNTDHLTHLREETAELNSRIQRAATCKLRVSSEAALTQDFERKVAQLGTGLGPHVEVLEQLEVVMDPTKDWAQEQMEDEHHRKQHDVEKLSKKKGELLGVVSRMKDEQLHLQRDWLDHHAALQAAEVAATQQEQLVQSGQEALKTLQEMKALASTTMACARGNIGPSPLLALNIAGRGSANPAQLSRPPSGSFSSRWVPRRSVLEDDELEENSSHSRQTSGFSSKESAPAHLPEASRGRRRSLFVDPTDPDSAWSIDSVVAEAVGEVMGSRPATGNWVSVFEEDSSGRFRRSAFAAQTALLSQLSKEEESLQADVEDLEREVHEKLQKALATFPKKDAATEKTTRELRSCERHAREAAEGLSRECAALLNLSCETGGKLTQTEFNMRWREVETCKMRQSEEDFRPETELDEVLLAAAENRSLIRRMTALGRETEQLQAERQEHSPRHSPRRRGNAAQSIRAQERWRNRYLRQQCRELNVLRKQVELLRREAADQEGGLDSGGTP